MKMKIFGFPVRLILCLLVVGMATALVDGWVSHPRGELDVRLPEQNPSASSNCALGSSAADCIHSVLEGWLATPAAAGDLNGDVQGD